MPHVLAFVIGLLQLGSVGSLLIRLRAASCSVPLVFSAASLLAKDPKTGKEVPWNPAPNAGWIDGSVDNDLPMTRLAEMFNVNHFIVSQVNPHVVPFLVKEEDNVAAEARQPTSAFTAGPSWLHSMANLAKGEALHRLHVLTELGIFPTYLTKARSILNQRYSGDITIFPAISYAQFPKVLSNPTTEFMLQSMLTGERATWPKLSRVKNHVAIELALDEAIRQLRTHVVFSPSQVDLRLNTFTRPLSQGDDRYIRRCASRPPHKITRFEHDDVPNGHNGQPSKPYFPSHPTRRSSQSLDATQLYQFGALDTFSSSTAADPSSSSGAESACETDTTDLLSSPSSPSSPSHPSIILPTLWPSTRQLFPSASQPATTSITTRGISHRNSSSLNLGTPFKSNQASVPPVARVDTPSTPELRYKRLFHPPANIAREEAVRPETKRENQCQPQPLAQMQGPAKPEIQLESQNRLQDSTPLFAQTITRTPSAVSASGREGPFRKAKKEAKQEKKDRKNAEQERNGSRRGSAQGPGLGLLLDISGTRGMMLRRKKGGGSESRGRGRSIG